jgi:CRISPR/Cas system type I-B associated protein Csh2 (Cas7 group RAMP superfamily)
MKTGSLKQVAAFGKLVGICNELGTRYHPSKASLTPIALASLLEQAQQNLEAVNRARIDFILAVNARRESYAGIYPLAARITRAVAASDGSTENLSDVRALKRKLLSKRSTKISAAPPVGNLEVQMPHAARSSSRLDYESKADTLAQLILIVENIPVYNPNETDLKVNTLKGTLADLRAKSHGLMQAANALAKARMERNEVLEGKNGLYRTGIAVKEYVRSVFGMNSDASHELAKIRIAA